MTDRERSGRTVPPELVAHRAGNDVAQLNAARPIADVIELDVHLRRGRLEVRHAKLLWPTSRLWERWFLLPRAHPVPTLGDILEAAGPDVHLWLDLKGVDPRLARRVRPLVDRRRSVTVSSKAWWVLRCFEGSPARRFRSAGNRFELFLLRRLPTRVRTEGVVVHERLLDRSMVERLAQGSPLVFCWGAQHAARVHELLEAGVGGLILDEHELIADLR